MHILSGGAHLLPRSPSEVSWDVQVNNRHRSTSGEMHRLLGV